VGNGLGIFTEILKHAPILRWPSPTVGQIELEFLIFGKNTEKNPQIVWQGLGNFSTWKKLAFSVQRYTHVLDLALAFFPREAR
jgi:hypothetical protein